VGHQKHSKADRIYCSPDLTGALASLVKSSPVSQTEGGLQRGGPGFCSFPGASRARGSFLLWEKDLLHNQGGGRAPAGALALIRRDGNDCEAVVRL